MSIIAFLLYVIGAANEYMMVSAMSSRPNDWVIKRSILWPYHAVKDVYDVFRPKS